MNCSEVSKNRPNIENGLSINCTNRLYVGKNKLVNYSLTLFMRRKKNKFHI